MTAPIVLQAAGATPNTETSSWQLNQRLLATVVNGADGRKNLRINGNLYFPLQQLQVEAGRSLTLIVKSLSSSVELGILHSTIAPRSERQPGIVLSKAIRQWPEQSLQNSRSSLVNFINFLNTPAAQPLPPTTAALMTALLDRITAHPMLTNPGTLKSALLNVGLLFTDSPSTYHTIGSGNAFTTQLIALIRSLATVTAAGVGGRLQPDGLALYQAISRADIGFPLLLARQMGEELLRTSMHPNQEQKSGELFERRWVFELPVNFLNYLGAVQVRLFEKKSRRQQGRPVPCWAAEFELALPGCGELQVELQIEDLAISIVITCTNESAVALIEKNQQSLRKNLDNLGLLLSRLQCISTVVPDTSVHLRNTATAHARRENIPLNNFLMRENGSELNPAQGIPEFLYCGMAALFSYLFDIEDCIGKG